MVECCTKIGFYSIYAYIMCLINEIMCIFPSTYCKLIALVLLSPVYAFLIVLVANVVLEINFSYIIS